jgi:hypothetical protein
MMERRRLVGGGMFAGAAAMLAIPEPAAAAAQRDDAEVARAVRELTESVEQAQRVPPAVARIREQQRVYLKANQKYPDYLEVGIEVWDSVYDWFVRYQQPIVTTRTADGRYVMTFMFTTLILRSDQTNSYVGYGFDAR